MIRHAAHDSLPLSRCASVFIRAFVFSEIGA